MIFCYQRATQVSRIIKRFCSIKLNNLTEDERIVTLRAMALPKCRENPVILKLHSPEFHSILTEEVQCLVGMFKGHGHEIRIAGGAVRDLLMGMRPKDLDFATTATPLEMKEMFTAENVRMINMNGEKHGTITPRINDKENFEVTTLRIDVVTDGRHAEVQFTKDWMLDSLRRDLTINSMFLDMEGSVYDFFYGYDDLKERRIRFVGDAATRIQEDYLRIMRYFRFYGRISDQSCNHEADTIQAIIDNRHGLKDISGERIWTELRKTLEGKFAGELLQKIVDCQLASLIGLPQKPNMTELQSVWTKCRDISLHPITLLASLLHTPDDAVALNARLKFSVFERELALFVVEHRQPKPHAKPLLPYQQLVLKSRYKTADSLKYVVELLKYNKSPYLEEFEKWTIPTFPINGKILKEHGVKSGKFMGLVLNELKHYWVDNNFDVSCDDLLKQLPAVLSKFEQKDKNK